MAHPDLMLLARLPQPVKQSARFRDGEMRAAKLAAASAVLLASLVPRAHFAAQLLAHHLLAITNAEDRNARLEQNVWRTRRAFIGHAGGRTGQDNALGFQPVEGLFRHAERRDFGIDPRLAHAARDQLGHLAAEIDDQDRFW